jgi:hypothetical protein
MGHAGTAHGFHQGLLDDSPLYIQGQLAGTLLGRTPAHAMGQAVDVGNLAHLVPLPLLGDGCGTMVTPLGYTVHILYFRRVIHKIFLNEIMVD